MPDPTFPDLPILGELGRALDAAMASELARAPAAARAAGVGPAAAVGPAVAVAQAAPRRARWWRARGPLPTVVVAVMLAGLGTSTAAATLTVLRGSPIPAPKPADVQPAMTPQTGSEQVLSLRAARPGGGAPFALRTGLSETGLTCVTVGQVDRGRFGVTGTDGEFREIPGQVVDGCGKLAAGKPAVLGARIFDTTEYGDVRTVVYGVAGPDLRRAELQQRGVWRTLTVRGGHFVRAVRGYPEDSAIRVRLTYADGKRSLYQLGVSRNVVVDPSGGPAWKFQAGSTQGAGTLCMDIFHARTTARAAHPAPVCGAVRGPRNYLVAKPYVLAIRTFRPGDRGGPTGPGSPFAPSWRWGSAPARTFAYGFVDEQRVAAVRVHAAGRTHAFTTGSTSASQPTSTHLTGGDFVVVLPGSVPASAVRVDFVLKDGTTKTFDRSVNVTPSRIAVAATNGATP